MNTRLLVVIPTHGRAALLERTLKSLSDCSFPPEYLGTIVIENGSKSGTERTVLEAPPHLRARYLYAERGNKSLALNRVLAETQDDTFLFFTDDDVRVSPNILEKYMEAARAMGPGTFFGGPTECDYEAEPPPWVMKLLPASARGLSFGEVACEIAKPSFLGFNWAAFASDLKAQSGFDYRRGPGSPSGSTGQESDMQRRLLKGGCRARYLPDAVVWHYVPIERCSPDWTLERAYRNGLQSRLVHQADGRPEVLRLFGVARAMAAHWMRSFPESLSAPLFLLRYQFRYIRGYLQNFRQPAVSNTPGEAASCGALGLRRAESLAPTDDPDSQARTAVNPAMNFGQYQADTADEARQRKAA